MRLLLINPRNPLVNIANQSNYWNKYRVWKPLGLLTLAGLTPREWEITVVDENVTTPDYDHMPRPDLVGVTSFTSQAPRAYELAALFRGLHVPVVMGGIHATVRPEEAAGHVDAVVTGEAESVWVELLSDAARGRMRSRYEGGQEGLEKTPLARHDLLPSGYQFGSIQTTRGCPLDCSFCSVSTMNGRSYRRRSVEDVVAEFGLIREKLVLVVDDNLVGTRSDHVERAKELFRAMIEADLGKKWICQATINMADDEELLQLASAAGCMGVFIGFESTSEDGLVEVQKKYNIQKGRDFRDSIRRIQRHRMIVAGSFIMGLDVDRPGIGLQIAETARRYGVDSLNVLFLTPLPGTRLWRKMEEEGRILADRFPEDWAFYTLTLPVGRYRHLSREEIVHEMQCCMQQFYSPWRILERVGRSLLRRRQPILTLVTNLSCRRNGRLNQKVHRQLERVPERSGSELRLPATGDDLHALAPDV